MARSLLVLGVVLHEISSKVFHGIFGPAWSTMAARHVKDPVKLSTTCGRCTRDERTHLCLTRSDKPCSKMGTTVWSRYVRIGKACASIFSCASDAAFSASAACARTLFSSTFLVRNGDEICHLGGPATFQCGTSSLPHNVHGNRAQIAWSVSCEEVDRAHT